MNARSCHVMDMNYIVKLGLMTAWVHELRLSIYTCCSAQTLDATVAKPSNSHDCVCYLLCTFHCAQIFNAAVLHALNRASINEWSGGQVCDQSLVKSNYNKLLTEVVQLGPILLGVA